MSGCAGTFLGAGLKKKFTNVAHSHVRTTALKSTCASSPGGDVSAARIFSPTPAKIGGASPKKNISAA